MAGIGEPKSGSDIVCPGMVGGLLRGSVADTIILVGFETIG